MSLSAALLLALVLDARFGEPAALYARMKSSQALIFEAISMLDTRLNHGGLRWLKGMAAAAVLVVAGWIIGAVIAAIPDFRILEIALAAMLFGHNALMTASRDVAEALQSSLEEGRHAAERLTGQDMAKLEETQVARASIEHAAASFLEAVIAPAFWFLLLGLPGMLVFVLASAADRLIGYHTEEYEEFGWAASRLAELLRWAPARLAGALICAAHRAREAFSVMLEDAPMHRSASAGWPVAALAAVIGAALGGPRDEDGRLTDALYVNPHGARALDSLTILEAIEALERSWRGLLIGVAGMAVLAFLF